MSWNTIDYKPGDLQPDGTLTSAYPFDDNGNELKMPTYWSLVEATNLFPLFTYYLYFRFLSHFVKKTSFKTMSGFKQYRLHNLAVCLNHSIISGMGALFFVLAFPEAVLTHPMHWYEYWMIHLPLLSIGYFIHDIMDMLSFEISRFTIELLLHHLGSIFAFASVIAAEKMLPFAYWVLLMEINSVFLHLRTIMNISKAHTKKKKLYKVIKILNIITFVIFRYVMQFWQLYWSYQNVTRVHAFYTILGLGGGITFLIINTFLFVRVLAADGYLGEFGRIHAAINRDASPLLAEKKKH